MYVKNIEGFWIPYSGSVLRMVSNDTSEDGLLLTYGEDVENQMLTSYLKLWKLSGIRQDYGSLGNMRLI